MNAGQIVEGWSNYFKSKFNTLDPKLKNLSELRLQICAECPIRTGSLCDPSKRGINVESGKEVKGCGCHLGAKSMSPAAKCPLDKW
jgi:hypothetical protein